MITTYSLSIGKEIDMKKWYTNDVVEKQFTENDIIPNDFHEGRLSRNWNRKLSLETRSKIAAARKGKPNCRKGTRESVKHIYYTNGIVSIRIPETDIPPEGFTRGRVKRKLTEEEKQSFNNKRQQTNIERYGDKNYTNIEKHKETMLHKYGVENCANVPEIIEKKKNTCKERYGADCVFASDTVKDKIKETLISKYGADNISKTELWKDKISDTWKSKSEDDIKDILEKREKTCLDRYGVTATSKCPTILDKISNTCKERYGVPFFCTTKSCRENSSNDSVPNKTFAQILDKNNIDYEREFVLDRKIYDFKIGNILIEINPTATHNSTWGIHNSSPLDKKYHYEKTLLAKSNDYHCINIWDWDNVDKILKLLIPRPTLYARKCSVSEISLKESNLFLDKYHLQGAIKSSIQIGLTYDNNLVAVMTFGKPRYNNKYQYELLRYASCYNITGGSSKLFTYFVNNYSPKSIISYCDFSKFSGKTYEILGFSYIGTSIGKHWYNMKTTKHITDNLLRQRGFDQLFNTNYGKGTSNEQLMKEHDFVEIYDAGQASYIWQNISFQSDLE